MIGGFQKSKRIRNVSILECGTHQCRRLPKLRVPRRTQEVYTDILEGDNNVKQIFGVQRFRLRCDLACFLRDYSLMSFGDLWNGLRVCLPLMDVILVMTSFYILLLSHFD
ncbi:hypothetical protein DY000_02055454 [Brassica cretica]|uniref:Transmembrane protein n=1 Tax=Brassica cretica TaxID=69181 RepID=A0ABQ7AEN3_BRACR|nr:hypothetical protein DY000_02055454 [Brassica cretica]